MRWLRYAVSVLDQMHHRAARQLQPDDMLPVHRLGYLFHAQHIHPKAGSPLLVYHIVSQVIHRRKPNRRVRQRHIRIPPCDNVLRRAMNCMRPLCVMYCNFTPGTMIGTTALMPNRRCAIVARRSAITPRLSRNDMKPIHTPEVIAVIRQKREIAAQRRSAN